MGDPNGTQYFRQDLGLHTDEVFIFAVAGKLHWERAHVETDLKRQLFLRTRNERAAESIKSGLMSRFDEKIKLQNLLKKGKAAYDAAKGAELTPKSIADACSSMLTGLFIMMKVENDLGQDCNPHTPDEEDYWGYMSYSYLTRGRVQPRYTKIF